MDSVLGMLPVVLPGLDVLVLLGPHAASADRARMVSMSRSSALEDTD